MDSNGVQATRQQHRDARNRAIVTDSLGVLRGGFIGAVVFKLTGNVNLARAVDGLVGVGGDLIDGRNQVRQAGTRTSEPVPTPGVPTGAEPRLTETWPDAGDGGNQGGGDQPPSAEAGRSGGESEFDDPALDEPEIVEEEAPETYESSALEWSGAGGHGEREDAPEICEDETPGTYESSAESGGGGHPEGEDEPEIREEETPETYESSAAEWSGAGSHGEGEDEPEVREEETPETYESSAAEWSGAGGPGEGEDEPEVCEEEMEEEPLELAWVAQEASAEANTQIMYGESSSVQEVEVDGGAQ